MYLEMVVSFKPEPDLSSQKPGGLDQVVQGKNTPVENPLYKGLFKEPWESEKKDLLKTELIAIAEPVNPSEELYIGREAITKIRSELEKRGCDMELINFIEQQCSHGRSRIEFEREPRSRWPKYRPVDDKREMVSWRVGNGFVTRTKQKSHGQDYEDQVLILVARASEELIAAEKVRPILLYDKKTGLYIAAVEITDGRYGGVMCLDDESIRKMFSRVTSLSCPKNLSARGIAAYLYNKQDDPNGETYMTLGEFSGEHRLGLPWVETFQDNSLFFSVPVSRGSAEHEPLEVPIPEEMQPAIKAALVEHINGDGDYGFPAQLEVIVATVAEYQREHYSRRREQENAKPTGEPDTLHQFS